MVSDEMNSFVGTVSFGNLLSKITDLGLSLRLTTTTESTNPWGTIEKIKIEYNDDAAYSVNVTFSDPIHASFEEGLMQFSDEFGIYEVKQTETRKDYFTADNKLEKYEITQYNEYHIKEDWINKAEALRNDSGDLCLYNSLSWFCGFATSTTVFVYRANGTLISKCEDCFCSSYSDIYGNIDDCYSLDGAFGRWYLYTYDENGENPVLTDDGAVAFGGEHVTWDDIP